jgi:hypothetical protein
MTDAISMLKANYCRSIMRTASIGTDIETRRLIDGLTTERPTPDTSLVVAEAEKAALTAIKELADQLNGSSIGSAGMQWTRAGRAIERWILSDS